MSTLLIVGAGGHGEVVADIAESLGCYSEIGFLDDSRTPGENGPLGYSILGGLSEARVHPGADFVVAIGNPGSRRAIMEQLQSLGHRVVTLVHPSAVVSRHAVLGAGTVVMPGAVIGPSVSIGVGGIVNTSASIDHDCRLSDFVHVSVGSHVAGTVTVGEGTWIGAGAVISNNKQICANCMIGAGAVVVRDITAPGTYIGVPARLMRGRDE